MNGCFLGRRSSLHLRISVLFVTVLFSLYAPPPRHCSFGCSPRGGQDETLRHARKSNGIERMNGARYVCKDVALRRLQQLASSSRGWLTNEHYEDARLNERRCGSSIMNCIGFEGGSADLNRHERLEGDEKDVNAEEKTEGQTGKKEGGKDKHRPDPLQSFMEDFDGSEEDDQMLKNMEQLGLPTSFYSSRAKQPSHKNPQQQQQQHSMTPLLRQQISNTKIQNVGTKRRASTEEINSERRKDAQRLSRVVDQSKDALAHIVNRTIFRVIEKNNGSVRIGKLFSDAELLRINITAGGIPILLSRWLKSEYGGAASFLKQPSMIDKIGIDGTCNSTAGLMRCTYWNPEGGWGKLAPLVPLDSNDGSRSNKRTLAKNNNSSSTLIFVHHSALDPSIHQRRLNEGMLVEGTVMSASSSKAEEAAAPTYHHRGRGPGRSSQSPRQRFSAHDVKLMHQNGDDLAADGEGTLEDEIHATSSELPAGRRACGGNNECDNSDDERQLELGAAAEFPEEGREYQATCAYWNYRKHWGKVIVHHVNREVFCHRSQLRGKFKALRVGEIVQLQVGFANFSSPPKHRNLTALRLEARYYFHIPTCSQFKQLLPCRHLPGFAMIVRNVRIVFRNTAKKSTQHLNNPVASMQRSDNGDQQKQIVKGRRRKRNAENNNEPMLRDEFVEI
eukprot:jgi/Bigna1/74108/fgenesh1_pg.27_\